MKTKITFIFLISIFALFYFKDYFLIQSAPHVKVSRPENIKQFANILEENLHKTYDFSGLSLKSNKKFKIKEGVFNVFHFWASWCEPCLNEIPDFIRFVQTTKSQKLSGVSLTENQFFLISLDYDLESLQKFTKIFPEILSTQFIQIWDKDSVLSKEYVVDKLPITIIVYPDGKVIFHDGVVNWKNFRL